MIPLRLTEGQLATRLKMDKPKNVYGWLNDGAVPDLLPIVKAGIQTMLGLGDASTASPVHQRPGILPALEVAMAKDRSLRKAIDELHSIYMARNSDPSMWRKVCEDLAATSERMQYRRGEARKEPGKVRSPKRRRSEIL